MVGELELCKSCSASVVGEALEGLQVFFEITWWYSVGILLALIESVLLKVYSVYCGFYRCGAISRLIFHVVVFFVRED